jgi:hypothetical protein
MPSNPPEKDLLVLVADQDMKAALESLLARPESLGIRKIRFEVRPHPRHDPGCRTQSAGFLRPFSNKFAHALVLFDHEGCGAEQTPVANLEEQVRNELSESGWGNRAHVIVLEPELESWIWSDSPFVDECCGWKGELHPLRPWIAEQFQIRDNGKPVRPKEAFHAALREMGKIPSSSIFRQLARRVSLERCGDPAFVQFKSTLKKWFSTT